MVVYPRWRGELNIGNGFAAAASGLSPLARGTRQNGLSSLVRLRFIPAGAGNTIVCKFAAAPLAVYPRWRGEHWSKYRQHVPYHGLSPLARGTHTIRAVLRPNIRFIPAGAGNTCRVKPLAADLAVYPRWRGEHTTVGSWEDEEIGLSPLARGTL